MTVHSKQLLLIFSCFPFPLLFLFLFLFPFPFQLDISFPLIFLTRNLPLSFLLLPNGGTASLMPDISTPPHHPLYRSRRCIDGGSDVEVEDWFAGGFRIAGVVIDYVADLFGAAGWCATGDVPVVAVKGGFAPVRKVVG
jgi:hypothetical protein